MVANLYKHILFCTDFSENADLAFETAKDLAWRYGADLTIAHVLVTLTQVPVREVHIPVELDSKFVEEATDAAQQTIQDKYVQHLKEKQEYKVAVLAGYPATEIVRLAEERDVDLIVMGAHGLTGIAHVLFGSTADRITRKAPCAVLTVRPKAAAK